MSVEVAEIAAAYACARVAAARMRVAEAQAALDEREREAEEAERVLASLTGEPTDAEPAPRERSPA